MALLKRVTNLFYRYPLASQGFVGASIQITGDVFTQKVLEKREKLECKRCFNSGMVGFATGCVLITWYRFLKRTMKYSNRFTCAILKVTADQLIFARVVTTLAAVDVADLLPDKISHRILPDDVSNFPDLMIVNYKYWPAVQTVNFYYVPLKFQVAFNSICAVAWNAFKTYEKENNEIDLEYLEDWLFALAWK